MTSPRAPEELEADIRAVGAKRYHDKHPFHRLLHSGGLNRAQVQAWALNRYAYQARIPVKDAIIVSRLPAPELRREWRRRLEDHDGTDERPGGIARWLALTAALGFARDYVVSEAGVLPGVRYACEAYVEFVRARSLLEAVASSLTELFAPAIIAERVSGMLAHYSFVDREALAYFTPRLEQAPRDSQFALDYVKRHAHTRTDQDAAIAAVRFKCDCLWAQLDALHYAYVSPGHVPPGAWRPE